MLCDLAKSVSACGKDGKSMTMQSISSKGLKGIADQCDQIIGKGGQVPRAQQEATTVKTECELALSALAKKRDGGDITPAVEAAAASRHGRCKSSAVRRAAPKTSGVLLVRY